jgi:hypothetical protein
MIRVITIVEGETEKQFIKKILAPYLSPKNVFITARLIGKPGHKGGVGNWPRAKKEICALLKQDQNVFCTTMFDLYGMPLNWPARKGSKDQMTIENAINKEIRTEMGTAFYSNRFFSYIQKFEFEALLFSSPKILADSIQSKEHYDAFLKINEQFQTPEDINDNPETAPSKRIIQYYPAYQKVFHGIIAAKRIGIETMRKKCHHFNSWIERLESY